MINAIIARKEKKIEKKEEERLKNIIDILSSKIDNTIDNFKFKRPVHPGDTLIFKLDLITPIRRGICNMRGYAFVNGQIVSEGDLMAQILRRT